MNLWRELPPGPRAPEVVYCIVEIPKGSRNKYEYQEDTGVIKLDRVLYSSMHYPGDYGLIPRTFCEDGDPLDILVMTNQPTFPGCLIEARPIGVFHMRDAGLTDDKILAVPTSDPLSQEYNDIADIPQHFLAEVTHFFRVYKDLEMVRVEALGWESAAAASEVITQAIQLFQEKFG
jgi:inorganic pyrophosphatase